MFDLVDFVKESNRIEGIDRDPSLNELNAHTDLIACNDV